MPQILWIYIKFMHFFCDIMLQIAVYIVSSLYDLDAFYFSNATLVHATFYCWLHITYDLTLF